MSVVEIVSCGPSQRLALGSDETTVCCPDCGSRWLTSERHARRIAAGEFAGTCKGCKRPEIKVTEAHRRYWLLRFGCDLHGRTAAEYLRDEPAPAELLAIIAEMEDVLIDLEEAA